MARVNISELRVTEHKILTHSYPEGANLFPCWSKGNGNPREGTCRPPINSTELLVIIIQPFISRWAPWKLTFQQHMKPQHVTNYALFPLLTRTHHSVLQSSGTDHYDVNVSRSQTTFTHYSCFDI